MKLEIGNRVVVTLADHFIGYIGKTGVVVELNNEIEVSVKFEGREMPIIFQLKKLKLVRPNYFKDEE